MLIVGAAEGRFPLQRRGDPLRLPDELGNEELGGGDAQLLEERRLFYVAMTRARDELVLTSASDYGTSRARKVSRFVIEALDLPSPKPVSRRTAPLEALARHARAPEPSPAGRASPIPEDELLRLSYNQIDDYETCPLKYRYVHVLRVPLLTHHAVVYGHAVHEAVRLHFEARLAGTSLGRRPGGRLPLGLGLRRLPVQGPRGRAPARGGRNAAPLPRRGGGASWAPTAVEQEFAFALERDRVQGRYDRVIEKAGETRSSTSRRASCATRRPPTNAPGRACSSTSTRWPI